LKDIIFDTSYHIGEIEVDPSWKKDFPPEYFEYRNKWDLATKEHVLYNFPLFLEVESSYACNYKCVKCPRQAINHNTKTGFLDLSLFRKLFDEAKTHKLPSITFSHGGEPLMRKDIPQLVMMAKEAGILDIMFHTNGSLLNKELSLKLIQNGMTKINFSLDAATSETYKKVREGGKYEDVVRNILDFLEITKRVGKSYPRVRVSFVLSNENKHEQKAFFDFWKDKVNVIAFQQCYDFTSALKTSGRDSDTNDQTKKKDFCCAQLWQLLTITADGDILVCERDYNHELVLGNLKTHTIYECWNSDKILEMRKYHLENRWRDIDVCSRCANSVKEEIEIEL